MFKPFLLPVVALTAVFLSVSATSARADRAEAYVNGDVNVNNQGDAIVAIGSAVGNIGSGVDTFASVGSVDINNSGDLRVAVGSVIGENGSVSNASASATVGAIRVNNGGHLKLAIGSIAK